MEPKLSKKQLIDAIRVERARWEMLLLRVGARRMSLPVDGTGRSVAEVVRTLYAKERWLLGELAPVVLLAAPTHDASVAGRQVSSMAHMRWTSPVEGSRYAFNELLGLLIPMCEHDLFAAGRFPWTGGRSLAEVVAACTIEYYVQHDAPIRSWLSRSGTPAAV